MRKVLSVFFFMLCMHLVAQENVEGQFMYIHLNDNTVECIAVSRIDSITFSQPESAHNAVDLGLTSGVKWASCNVGASSPEEYGGYYAWGERMVKEDYTSATALYYQKNIGDDISATSYDVARAEWGGSWRLPTKSEQEELLTECSWEWTSLNGVNGYRVTGVNGNSIFLPAAGYRYGTYIYYAGVNGYYWSSTIYCILNSYFIYYDKSYTGIYYYARFDGLTVRPVCE
ncbi:MAG: hypothetical protein IKA52_02860 [Bacteroidaceae bacterium]|nr:hypothetical protein [Bacteroidaceae bacterium]